MYPRIGSGFLFLKKVKMGATMTKINLDLKCLGCKKANLDSNACPNSETHPGVKVGEWRVHSTCLDCCNCPEHKE